jgi:4a-hydroxytetrahydrobiopterin dehydratase
MRALLDDARIAEELGRLPGWRVDDRRIVREVEAPSFRAAVRLIGRIADLAEGADHHPDLHLSWRRLRVVLWTHDAGGLTARDFHLARCIEDVISDG